MNRIEKLIEELCPNGVEYLKLEEILKIKNGKDHKHLDDGEIPVYGSGGIMRHVSQAAANGPSVLIPRKGSLGNLFYVEGPFWVVDTIFRTEINEVIALPKFVFYELQTLGLGEMNQAGGVPSQTQSKLNKLKIPVPPLEVQEEIVKILDTFKALEAELEAELEARKKQYKFYRDQLLTFTERERVRWSPLSDIGTWTGGGTPSKRNPEFWSNGTIPWISPKDMGGHEITSSQDLITSAAVKNSSAKMVPEGSILLVTRSSILDHTFPINQALVDVTINQDLKAVTTDPSILPRFVLYYLRNSSQDILCTVRKTGGSVASLDTRKLFAFPIPIPPLEEQQRIVNILDQFDALVNDLTSGLPAEIEARRKQYEYYRDQLLTFKELAA